MKRILSFVLMAVLALTLCGCGGGNELFAEAAPEQSALIFYSYDDDTGLRYTMFDEGVKEELLDALSDAKAKSAENWTPDRAGYPMYGINIGTPDGRGLYMLWTNGYLITRQGEVYEFDFDFAGWGPKVRESVEGFVAAKQAEGMGKYYAGLVSECPIGYMPNFRYLALHEGEWKTDFLSTAGEKNPPEGIAMELVSAGDEEIVVKLRNESGAEWSFGEYFSIEVCIDGTWYTVPPRADENWGFNDIAQILKNGEETEKSFRTTMYGELPAGDYRIAVEGLTAEFEIE